MLDEKYRGSVKGLMAKKKDREKLNLSSDSAEAPHQEIVDIFNKLGHSKFLSKQCISSRIHYSCKCLLPSRGSRLLSHVCSAICNGS